MDFESETLIAHTPRGGGFDEGRDAAIAFSCKDDGRDATVDLSPTMRSMTFDQSHANAGGQLAIAFNLRGREEGSQPEVDPDGLANIRAASGGSSRTYVAAADPIAFNARQDPDSSGEITHPLDTHAFSIGIAFDTTQITSGENRCNPRAGDPCHPLSATAHPPAWATMYEVRRLTPTECERLMGVPDDYTNIPYRGRNDAPDGPRYKALGNGFAVPVVRWIGERIAAVHEVSAP